MRILVIDDESLYCENLAFALKNAGFDVRTATNTQDGIAAGTETPPDLLITDWMFKNHLVGRDVLNRLRGVNPKLRSILITGLLDETVENAVHAGFDDVLVKPFHTEQLVALVRRLLAPPHDLAEQEPNT